MKRILYAPVAQLNPGAEKQTPADMFDEKLLKQLAEFHNHFQSERKVLLASRERMQKLYDAGAVPQFIEDHPAQDPQWRVSPIPKDLLDRRVEITGPASQAKMVIQMMNPTPDGPAANMAMLDMEDSMKPSWSNVVSAIQNIEGVARGDLSFIQKTSEGIFEKEYRLAPQSEQAHPMIRIRGLHLDESNVTVGGEPISAGLFDFVVTATKTARLFIHQGRTPKFYIPKCEHYLEARWWNRLFVYVERSLDIPRGTLKATFLIETLPAAFQMEEILFEAKERVCGLNGGRWDKIFSDIKTLKAHKERISPDRSFITMEKSWMENYAKRLIKICHRRGAFAMGGMSAFTPGRDPATRDIQLSRVIQDKRRESDWGHDGCWVSHPYFIKAARAQFAKVNQLDIQLNEFPERPNLLPLSIGPKTMDGLRTNIRVAIAYQQGWDRDLGCVAFDNLMEDLATYEISRAQVWQWLHHHVELDTGERVTPQLVEKTFHEELQKIHQEVMQESTQESALSLKDQYTRSMYRAKSIFLSSELQNFLSTASEPVALEEK